MLTQVIIVSGIAFITVLCDSTRKRSDTKERKLEFQEKLIQEKIESVTSSFLLHPFFVISICHLFHHVFCSPST